MTGNTWQRSNWRRWAIVAIVHAMALPAFADPPKPEPFELDPGSSKSNDYTSMLVEDIAEGVVAEDVREEQPIDARTGDVDWGAVFAERETGGFYATAEYLWIQPRRGSLQYATSGTQSETRANTLNFLGNSAYQVGAGYSLDNAWRFGGSYQHFDSASNSSANESSTEYVAATLSNPFAYPIFAQRAYAETAFNYNVIDLDVNRRFDFTDNGVFNIFVGPRAAMINQHTSALYDGGEFYMDRVESTVNFAGYGARLGGKVEWLLGEEDRIRVYGMASGSLMYGNTFNTLKETLADGYYRYNGTRDYLDSLARVAELGFGIAYRWTHFSCSIGYQINTWYHMAQRRSYNPKSEGSHIEYSDLILGGPRIEMGFYR